MQWRIELIAKAAQAINKLDAPQRERIRATCVSVPQPLPFFAVNRPSYQLAHYAHKP